MALTELDDSEKIETILNWADDHPNFDTSFVEEMESALDEFGELTEAQSAALDNIMEGFHI